MSGSLYHMAAASSIFQFSGITLNNNPALKLHILKCVCVCVWKLSGGPVWHWCLHWIALLTSNAKRASVKMNSHAVVFCVYPAHYQRYNPPSYLSSVCVCFTSSGVCFSHTLVQSISVPRPPSKLPVIVSLNGAQWLDRHLNHPFFFFFILSSSFLLLRRLISADKRMERCGEIGKRDVAGSGGWTAIAVKLHRGGRPHYSVIHNSWWALVQLSWAGQRTKSRQHH